MINLPLLHFVVSLFNIHAEAGRIKFLAASTKYIFQGPGRPFATNFSEIVKKGAEHMFSCSGCLFFHVSLQIDFNLLPKSTFNLMEGGKLCTAFVSVTILKTCEKKNWQHVTLNLVFVTS